MISSIVSVEKQYYKNTLSELAIPNDICDIIVQYIKEAFIEKGAFVDVKDKFGHWCLGQIKEDYGRSFKVTFVGWAPRWDVILTEDDPKLMPLFSRVKLETVYFRSTPLRRPYQKIDCIDCLLNLGYSKFTDRQSVTDLINSSSTSTCDAVSLLACWILGIKVKNERTRETQRRLFGTDPTGHTGPIGPTGYTGSIGYTGPVGPNGVTGPRGRQDLE